jgi:hypothetical protein
MFYVLDHRPIARVFRVEFLNVGQLALQLQIEVFGGREVAVRLGFASAPIGTALSLHRAPWCT